MNTTKSRNKAKIVFTQLPVAARVTWIIALLLALTALTMITLEFFEVWEGNLKLELIICNLAVWTNVILTLKYRDEFNKR